MSIEYPDLMHKDLVDHAVRSGYPVEEPFNYAKAYIHYDTLSTSGIFRRCCTEQQLHRPKHAFEIADMLIALRDHSCNDEWTGAAGCVCMHAKNPTPPINPRQSIDCETDQFDDCGFKARRQLYSFAGDEHDLHGAVSAVLVRCFQS